MYFKGLAKMHCLLAIELFQHVIILTSRNNKRTPRVVPGVQLCYGCYARNAVQLRPGAAQ